MSGIYIHIPFCRKACHYCDFAFTTRLGLKNELLAALKKELVLRKNVLGDDLVESLYFGGGTPSLLEPNELHDLLEVVHKNYKVSPSAEITLEANPEDLSLGKAKALVRSPVNRFSVGIQSFFDCDLKTLGRAHSSGQAELGLKNLLHSGASSVSIDLIYGVPSMGTKRWEANLQKVLDYGLGHLSAYALTVEKGTALAHRIAKGRAKRVSDEDCLAHFSFLMKWAKANGYDHYEISNLCLPGNIGIHNSNYWRGKSYLGVGPSAHSFDGLLRRWNPRHIKAYNNLLRQGKIDYEQEVLSKKDRYNEYVLTRLRTKWGLQMNDIRLFFGDGVGNHCWKRAQKGFAEGNLIVEAPTLHPSREAVIVLSDVGKFYADGVASDLFLL